LDKFTQIARLFKFQVSAILFVVLTPKKFLELRPFPEYLQLSSNCRLHSKEYLASQKYPLYSLTPLNWHMMMMSI